MPLGCRLRNAGGKYAFPSKGGIIRVFVPKAIGMESNSQPNRVAEISLLVAPKLFEYQCFQRKSTYSKLNPRLPWKLR